MVIRRWDPFIELRRMQENMAHYRRGIAYPGAFNGEADGWAIPLDVMQEDGQFVVQASMPGVNPADIKVVIDNDVLTIRGRTVGEGDWQQGNYLVRERRTGAFHRAVRLPDTLDVDQAHSRYDNGVLTIAFPKSAATRARELPVAFGGEEPAVVEKS